MGLPKEGVTVGCGPVGSQRIRSITGRAFIGCKLRQDGQHSLANIGERLSFASVKLEKQLQQVKVFQQGDGAFATVHFEEY
jgi:hypothetical protein